MGRQINFYMDKEIEKLFIDFLFEKGFKIYFHDFGKNKDTETQKGNDINSWYLILHKESYGRLVYNKHSQNEIDVMYSPVFEFIRTDIDKTKQVIKRGRIWKSSEIIFQDDETESLFTKDYNAIVRWIRKNAPRQNYYDGFDIRKDYISNKIKKEFEYSLKFF